MMDNKAPSTQQAPTAQTVDSVSAKQKRKRGRIILLILVLLCGALYFFVPSIKSGVNNSVRVLSKLGIDGVIEYIRSFGAWAAVVSFGLMVLQSVLSPIPAFLITLSNAVIFGWVKGALLSWTSAMAGAALCFWIARVLGRDVVGRFATEGALKSVDSFFARWGKQAILVARLLPFISFDVVSYAAGLTSMGFWSFFLATGLGQLPATIVYSYVGGQLTGGAKYLMIGLLVLFSLFIIIYVAKRMYNERQARRGDKGV